MAEREKTGISIDFYGNTVEFDKSVDGVNKALKTTKSELSTLNKQLKLDPKNLDLLEKKFKSLKQYQSLLKDQVANYRKELDSMSKEEVGSKKWQELTKQMQNAQIELTKVEKDIQSVNSQISKTESLAGKLGSAFNNVSKETKKIGDALAPVSKAAAAVTGAIAGATISAGKNADEINTLAKQYQLTTDQIQKFQLASDLIDVDLSTITKSYAKLTKSMTSSSKETVAAFNTLGVKVKDANGELRSTDDVFNEVIQSLGNIKNETQQDAIAMSIFGKSAAELGPLINGGSEQLAEFNKYLEENGLLLSQEELDALTDMNDGLDTVKATIKALSQRIALDFAPAFQKIFSKVNEVILQFKEKWDQLSPAFKETGLKVSAITATLSPLFLGISKITGSIGGILTKIAGNGGLIKTLTSVLSPTKLIIGGLAALYATNENFRNSVNGLVKNLAEHLQPAFQKIMEFVQTYVMPTLQRIGEAVVPVIISAVETLSDILDFVFGILGDIWGYLEDLGVIDAFGKAFEWIGDIIEKVAGWFETLFGWIRDVIDAAKNFDIGEWWNSLKNYDAYDAYKYAPEINGLPTASGGYGYSSGGFGPITLNADFTINSQTQISKSQVQGWAREMADVINIELGRRI